MRKNYKIANFGFLKSCNDTQLLITLQMFNGIGLRKFLNLTCHGFFLFETLNKFHGLMMELLM